MDSPDPSAPADPGLPPTASSPGPGSAPPQLKLDFASGGWVLWVAGVLGVWLFLHLTWPLLTGKVKAQQESATAEQLGFNLQGSLVPRDQIVSGAKPGSIPPLVMPGTVKGSDVDAMNLEYRHKYHHKFVVTGDRVVGVTINGESRAYQLKVLQWHEVANDVLGGVPIAVTYSPLCDSVVVFDRRFADETLVFEASGLLYNSNTLLQNFTAAAGNTTSSLWSQLGRRAIAGPRVGTELTVLPCELTHWGNWLVRHPDTTLLSTDTGVERDYTQNAYGAYYDREKLRFPVTPQLPASSPTRGFTLGLAVQHGAAWQAYNYPQLASSAVPADLPAEAAAAQDQRGKPDPAHAPLSATVDGAAFIYEPSQAGMEPPTVRVTGDPQPCVYGLWWALYAFGYLK